MSAPTKSTNSTKPTEPILLSPPHLSGEEIKLITNAIESNWIAPVGPDLDAFEAELAAKVGVSAAAGVSSGTAALHLALQILGVGSGDEVLCSTFTFAASANPILYCGATRADYDPILTSCAEFDVPVISDAAEALGASYAGRKAGSLGDIAIVSFNGNKILTCSGGGALLSDNPEYAERARFLATQARDPAPHYEHTTVGYNYRLSNLLAAIGRGQLRVLEDRVRARRAIRELYKEELADVPGITFAPEADYGQSNGWLTCILVDERGFGASREDIREHLGSLQIESRPLWKPMHEQPVFKKYRAVGGDISSSLFRDGLCLPSGSALPADSVVRIASEIAGVGK